MGSLKQYSGLTTKVKAMRSRLISKDEYEKIIDFETVSEIAEYLRNRGGFEKVLENADISNIHRETVEHAIVYSGYNDFEKLYKFAGLEQRRFLKLYFITYEVEMIKKAIRKSSSHYITKEQDEFIKEIFGKYSRVRFEELFKAMNISEIIRHLEGTIYYEPLKQVQDVGRTEIFDYELALDMFYFKYIWRKRRLNFSGGELRAISDSIGSEVDVLNLTWIYRAKRFYKMTQSGTASMIIPVYHRVKKSQILKLIEINGIAELVEAIGKTPYGKYFTPDTFKEMELDKISKKLVTKVYDKYYRTQPYSMAVMSSYLRDKREEMNKLITIVECIRYGYSKDDIAREIL